jgi:hypothetical protein
MGRISVERREGSFWQAGFFLELPLGPASSRGMISKLKEQKTNSRDPDAGAVSAVISPIRVIRDNLRTLWPDSGARRTESQMNA